MGSAYKALATSIPKGVQLDTFNANTDRAQDRGVGKCCLPQVALEPATEEMSDVFWKAGHEKPR